MSARDMPEELWLLVFKNVPPEALQAISLTHRAFCWITRPLIFVHLKFHPYCIHSANGTLLLPQKEHIDMALERLDFWSSDRIAPSVRSCTITSWRYTGQSLPSTWTTSQTPHVLLNHFLARIARLAGVKEIHVHDVYFTQMAITKLCRLPALTSFHVIQFVNGPSLEVTSDVLSISRLTVKSTLESAGGLTRWMLLLRPDSLLELDIHCNLRVFCVDLPSIPPFPRVHKLSIDLNFAAMSSNVAIFVKFPGVHTLTINGHGRLSESPQDLEILPALTEYRGSVVPLATFLHTPKLTNLTIDYCSPDDFVTRLQSVHRTLNITSLEIEFDRCDHEKLRTLCDLLPHLTELRLAIAVEIDKGENEEDTSLQTSFFQALLEAPGLTQTLEQLSICWVFKFYSYELPPDGGEPPNFSEIRAVLVARCPALKSLWIDGHEFVFRWRQAVDGTTLEEFSDDHSECLLSSWRQ
ncbi:hypothetical protein B0H16DRAFT_786868 [Mycena metata]|uniref:F-box domain-containing protein n=1 Tax=Mycena metata TaxID=1033252 RepID=A0AAD7IYQ3_9AGAR|nr:hypothetical protein B0H16DRAFT_786868 [Mycena metata]